MIQTNKSEQAIYLSVPLKNGITIEEIKKNEFNINKKRFNFKF